MSPAIKFCLASLIMISLLCINPGCSDDGVGPEPEPEPRNLMMGVAYQDRGTGDLKYVEKTGEFWEKPEFVAYQGSQGWYASLALDAQGTPHISWHEKNTPGDLWYAFKGEDGWQRFLVDANGNTGNNSSIALDPQGMPHIVYQNATTAEIKYASYIKGAGWTIETVEEAIVTNVQMPCGRQEYGFPIPLVIDASGAPHISWVTGGATNCSGGDFAYATRPANSDGDDWDITIVDDSDCVGYCADIDLDAQGNPHISYVERGIGQVKYAWKIGDNDWDTDLVTSPYPVSGCRYPTSIALDPSGTPHISYHAENDDLVYVVQSSGSGWNYELVDSDGDVGRFCSLALDAQGNPCIAYWDRSHKNVKCAVRTDEGWAITVVDNSGSLGWFTSIDLVYR